MGPGGIEPPSSRCKREGLPLAYEPNDYLEFSGLLKLANYSFAI